MKFYRYDYYSISTDLDIITFSLIKETECGYWIKQDDEWCEYRPRWVSKIAKKCYAYPTQKEALDNFIRRKELRLAYLTADVNYTKTALEIAKNNYKTVYGIWEE